ncbi:nucleotidyltransferase domain-containing protein [Nocardia pseudovaccinii]|uniref:nucleotidyltransferase domain-containing protein n=1 Tax=Nocardia pseudovaccinii TaxID=189540 RepID=UPI0007A48CFF|nr:nucleotidyltransferase domain-containing protein [Nocardia pseudovaccinii]
MSLRAIPASMDPMVVGSIDAELDRIEHAHRVSVPLAIESGGRAWGFPSPDSDYDCRFVYVAQMDTYLSPWPTRDVIETRPVGLLDVNGWDLTKALRLLRPAVALRWLREHPDAAVAPMHLPSLREQCEWPGEPVSAIAELKSHTREMGSGAVPLR